MSEQTSGILDETWDLILARRLVEEGVARQVRESHGLSRGETARACHVTVDAVRLWEKGLRRPHGVKGAAYGRLLRGLLNGGGQ